jgi:hypothetical protein
MGLAQWRYIHALVSIRLDAFAPLVIDKALDFCAISTPSLEGVPKACNMSSYNYITSLVSRLAPMHSGLIKRGPVHRVVLGELPANHSPASKSDESVGPTQKA